MDRQEENSPLLSKLAVANLAEAPHEIQPTNEPANEDGISRVKSADGGESQITAGNRAAQYEGMPEIKAKLKYIVPTVGIGVREYSRRMY